MAGQVPVEFINTLVMVLSSPQLQCDIALNCFFPEVKRDFDAAHRLATPRNVLDVYNWLAPKFNAPVISELDAVTTDPDRAFRELMKYIMAKAFNMTYTPAKLVMVDPNAN